MKKISQWLEELPEPYRKQALENQKKEMEQNGLKNEMEHDSLKNALLAAFAWHLTEQRFDYWNDFFDSLP